MSLLDDAELRAADAAVERAVATGSARGLPVLGHGEISSVLAWPPEAPRAAIKRLPRFSAAPQLARYEDLLGDYLAAITGRGVRPVTTQVWAAPDRQPRAFLVQPLLPAGDLLSTRLAQRPAGHPEVAETIGGVVDQVVSCVDGHVGLDAQVSNWAVGRDGALRYIDVSTPFLRDAHGTDRLDLRWLCSVYAAAARPLIRRVVAPGVVAAYHDPRRVLLDLGANLHREGLDRHVGALLGAARAAGTDLRADDIRRYFISNVRTWKALRAMRRADARWQRHVRRRPYPFLLPEID